MPWRISSLHLSSLPISEASNFTMLTTTNLSLPSTNWSVPGAAAEGPLGNFQFTDPQATNNPLRFYRVRSP